ncbi:glutamate receptor ionotropic, delta-2-like [Branchiostoma floridae]|uniref:Glutamate receptor ionotropic, delta-2-like n=1 Tax=Branchiostoma floridae TaxID=7739 RepID=A0A9J7NCM8_BRAFL|nr:glutamate receptor ionotropic, delta-2-like [Branchiostoma floridae]
MWLSVLVLSVWWAFSAGQTTTATTSAAQPSVQGQFFRVVTFEEAPFAVKSTTNNETSWRGFCVDLLEALATRLQFTYNLTESSDGHEGTLHAGTGWTGAVGDVVDGNADMIVAALTITSHREDVIDFTKPYMEYGIGMLMKVPDVHGTYDFWAFLAPFTLEVWMTILGSSLGVAGLMFLLAAVRSRLTRGALEDEDINLGTTLWVSVGWITGDIAIPGGISIKVLGLSWGIFTLVVVNTYTANLAASLTVKSLQTSINSPDDLIGQTAITYGIEVDTAMHSFLQDQEGLETTYDKMWTQMQTHPDGLQTSLDAAVTRVREGDYIFIHDGPWVEYEVLHDEANSCQLMMVGNTFLHRSYAIGLPHGSPYTEELTISVLEMKENGEIDELTTKWWPASGCDLHGGSNAVGSGEGHVIAEFYGILSILGAGAGLALIVAACEIAWFNLSVRKKKVTPATSETQEEMIRRVVRECLRETAKVEEYNLDDAQHTISH